MNRREFEKIWIIEWLLLSRLKTRLSLVSRWITRLFLVNKIKTRMLLVSSWNTKYLFQRRDKIHRDMIYLDWIFLILKLSNLLRLLKEQKFCFFSNSIIDFNRSLTAINKTKEREYDKCIEFKIDINDVTTKSWKTYNDEILIQFRDIEK